MDIMAQFKLVKEKKRNDQDIKTNEDAYYFYGIRMDEEFDFVVKKLKDIKDSLKKHLKNENET